MSNHATHECVQLVPIFQALADEQLDTIESIVQHRHYQAGETLFSATDDLDSLMIVANGQVKVYQLAANGREQLLYLLQTGDIDGEAALFENQQRTSYGEALVPTDICRIRRQDFQQLMQSYPSISINVLNVFGKRLAQLEKQTTRTATESVEARLATYLTETAASLKVSTFKLPLKKKDLATFLGTTPETISRKLTRFEQQGFITQKPGKLIQINDADQLLLVD
ncbi:Crp/Fnr family transcriptional regulator [Lactiplantibacillus mudanjiangensis]|uniref:Crp/Fnr family transcriptional regulator [Lactobacillus sp.] n=1 Tax=Lactiplantibacillus mudanjiangensis TaxID=1296538 RepID=A0A660E4Q7_9LACO|nr:Crp/Fnr family transcriptional regulator [Lactiplantibacillus mudanjiangensis]VDG21287.1 Crp/Fnr family transcriptional regulator [Lactobacillus sp.] [Lactiplantibacillus mudanjiangensis]VDG22453.1 Crp/Fnr family transcriptional regulator [Lactobacillus sp.] [Lactiplantibacillus mudanjiangensis]VDG27017.1 Crp/Fnr family transcriptional regulator [Lactobacillus sp.] [Lactiplantibacillus mudanjiangensis]VDG32114.1 Crp/Fnr family transcriptional regulator [Lactobacillus sp.] [Lactiplantibacillu